MDSESDVRHGQLKAAGAVLQYPPSFSSMVFRCGEAKVVQA